MYIRIIIHLKNIRMKIPVNVLDKVKYELNTKNPHQYFYTFLTYTGTIDTERLQSSFERLYSLNEKLNKKLYFDGCDYEYKQYAYKDSFYQINCINNEDYTPELLIESRAKEYIERSEEAPIILILLKKPESYSLVFCHNHIFYDGTTAYAITNQLVSLYNGRNLESPLRTCSDGDAIKERIKLIPNFKYIQYYKAIVKHIWSSLKYTSSFNEIKKIYKNKPINDVHFYSLTIPNPRNSSNIKYSTNTIICAHIADAFLKVKGKLTDQTVSLAIPSNFRNENQFNICGNLVNSISVKLTGSMSLSKSCEVIQNKTGLFKNNYREIAAYRLLNVLAGNKKGESLIATFRKISKKHHFYVTNLGDISQRCNISFADCELVDVGGFNFPIQEDYGLIFTVVPFNNVVKIGIATSSDILSEKDVNKICDYLSESL